MGNVAQRSMRVFQAKEEEQTALSTSNHSTDSCETLETTTILTAVSRDSGQTEVLGYEVSHKAYSYLFLMIVVLSLESPFDR